MSAYTVTLSPDATATIRSRAVLLKFRLIAAARLVALVGTVLDTKKFNPVFELADAAKVRVSPVGVIVMAVVPPLAARR